MLLLSRKEKEKLVIRLAKEGKTTREIAKIVHISLKDIGEIIRKVTVDENDSQSNKNEKEKERLKTLSTYAQAFQIFREKKPLTDVVITLDLDADTVLDHYRDYSRLNGMYELVVLHDSLGKDLPLFIHLFNRIKKEGLLNREQISKLLQTQHKLCDLPKLIFNYENYIEDLKEKELVLMEKIEELNGSLNTDSL